MFKKIILILVVIVFFSGFNLAYANVVINEVQLSPTGERFVELYNTGDSEIDLTGWYMQRKTATGSSFGSLVPKTNFEGKTIGAHDYFVISRASLSNSDIIFDSLTLTESNTIQIKKSEQEVVDKIGWGDASDCGDTCPANPGEGQSIQKTTNGLWVTSTPTPGKANEVSSTPPIDDSGDDSNNSNDTNTSTSSSSSSTTTSKTSTTKKTTTSKIKAEIITKSLAYADIPLLFQGRAFGNDGKQAYHGRYFWNFGDGDSREVKVINTDKFTHTYFYPGEYTVSLDYFPDAFADVPDASDSIVIKVVAPGVSISAVGNEKDFFVELSNTNDYDVDVSRFLLASDYRTFKIPVGTILKSKKKMIISPRLTNMGVVDKNSLKLLTSEGELVFAYSAPQSTNIQLAEQKKIGINSTTRIFSPTSSSGIENDLPLGELSKEETPAENLSAGAFSSVPYMPAIASIVLVGASAGTVYFIRRKRTNPSAGDDFDILDE